MMIGIWRYAAIGAGFGGVLTVIGGLYVSVDVERQRDARSAWSAAASAGVGDKLSAVFEGRISTIVVRPILTTGAAGEAVAVSNEAEFRGAIERGPRTRSVVGRAGWDCEPAADAAALRQAECWMLKGVLVDGDPVTDERALPRMLNQPPSAPSRRAAASSAAPEIVTGDAPAPQPQQQSQPELRMAEAEASGAISTGAIAPAAARTGPAPAGERPLEQEARTSNAANAEETSRSDDAAAAQEAAAPMETEGVAAAPIEPALTATHRITARRANLREGPSTRFPSLRLAERGFPLAFIRAEGGWTEFKAVEGPLSGRALWVYTPLTAPLR
ncbi:MAG: hypothetical protein AAGM38_04135 [Pseudomonadota bacterium]